MLLLLSVLYSCCQPNSLLFPKISAFLPQGLKSFDSTIFLFSQLLRFGINHVICHDELKMSMLACATMFPAFLPFAINAMRSSSDYSVPVNNT